MSGKRITMQQVRFYMILRGARTAFADEERLTPPRFLGDPCDHALLFDPGGVFAPGHLLARAL